MEGLGFSFPVITLNVNVHSSQKAETGERDETMVQLNTIYKRTTLNAKHRG